MVKLCSIFLQGRKGHGEGKSMSGPKSGDSGSQSGSGDDGSGDVSICLYRTPQMSSRMPWITVLSNKHGRSLNGTIFPAVCN